jgi:hypothetical protein
MLHDGASDAEIIKYLTDLGVDAEVARTKVDAARLPKPARQKRQETPAQKAAREKAQRDGRALERKAQQAAAADGEVVIQSQERKGAVDKGFDFLSYTGTGKDAKLFINEAKAYNGNVTETAFSCFGMGRRAKPTTLNESIKLAREAIIKQVPDAATREALLAQLDNKTATVRLFGVGGTVVNSDVLAAVQAKGGWPVSPDIRRLSID